MSMMDFITNQPDVQHKHTTDFMNVNIRNSLVGEIVREARSHGASSIKIRVTEAEITFDDHHREIETAAIEYKCIWDHKPRREFVRPSEAAWIARQYVVGFGKSLKWLRVIEAVGGG